MYYISDKHLRSLVRDFGFRSRNIWDQNLSHLSAHVVNRLLREKTGSPSQNVYVVKNVLKCYPDF